jgi:hypothetical protein
VTEAVNVTASPTVGDVGAKVKSTPGWRAGETDVSVEERVSVITDSPLRFGRAASPG